MAKRRRFWLISVLVVTLVAGGVWSWSRAPVMAQDSPNLLTNGSLERPYYGQGASTRTVPQGWNIWVGAGAPEAFPHTDRIQVLDGEVAWNVKQGYTAFTAAGYQRVGGLQAGDTVTLTGYGWVYTCNDTSNSCIISDPPYRRSDPSAEAMLKVGIDPAGGTDPNSANVQWSASAAPYDQWAQMSVSATATGDAVTVFLYMTQAKGLALNNVYWDKISLVRSASAPAATPTAQYAPFVVPQAVRPDGSVVHVVQAGDTLSAIVYAYREYNVTAESIAALNTGLKPNTRVLQIGQEIVILPPGSVDPTTGKLRPQGAPPIDNTPAAPTLAPSAAPAANQGEEVVVAQNPTPVPPEGQQQVPPVTYVAVRASYFPFEHGAMFWLEDVDQVYVLTNGTTPLDGTFKAFRNTWREGMPETDPSIQPPAGLTQPDKSFGQAWRTYPGVRDSLGWGTGTAHDYTALVVRQGANITISGPDNRVYELSEDGTWRAVDYYAQP
jgi:LysM repeat protein